MYRNLNLLVNAVVLPTCAVILHIVFETDIMLVIDKKQLVKVTGQSVKSLAPPTPNILASNNTAQTTLNSSMLSEYSRSIYGHSSYKLN
jgi:hypothetical protein